MLIAFDVIFTRLLAVNVLWAKLGLGFAAVALSAILYGPVWAGVTAALGDLTGSLLFPTGAFFPGFTATAAITGIIFGLMLHGERPDLKRCFFAALINVFLVTLVLNSLMIILVFEPSGIGPLMLARGFEALLMLIVETGVLHALTASDALYARIEQLKNK